MGEQLKPCPCGETPSKLHITGNGQGYKWADATGDCCGEWSIEFRTQYLAHGSPECMELAIEAWNGAPRKPALMTHRLNTAEAKVRELEGWLDIAWNGLEEAGYQGFDIGLKEFMEDSSDDD